MKNFKLFFILAISFTSLSCGVLPIETVIKENHFRFENFKRDKSLMLEYVYLMCFRKKETRWTEPKQYLNGEHDLWVKASISTHGARISRKEAFVNFKVNLDSDKSYMLNRKITEDKISIWIQEVDTGLRVSDVQVADLKRPLLIDHDLQKTRCKSGSI